MIEPPYAIARQDDGLSIEWGPGLPPTTYPARALRLACPCAQCVDEMSGRALLDPGGVPEDVRAVKLQLIGNYGLKVWWSDGHHTGIYTFEALHGGLGRAG
jgi:ATP-binding protein involved in chromosome partitioning